LKKRREGEGKVLVFPDDLSDEGLERVAEIFRKPEKAKEGGL